MDKEDIAVGKMHLQIMNMKLLEKIYEDQHTSIACPHCKESEATLDWKNASKYETPASIHNRADPDWEPEWQDYKYSVTYKCNQCEGITISSGDVTFIQLGGIDYETGQEDYEDYFEYTPRHFTPALNLMQLPKKCPREISQLLSRSFQLAFCDQSASANRLRVALEYFVNINLPKDELKGSLYKKLVKLEEKLKESSALSTAIRIIGNQGSHSDDDVPQYHLAFAYKAFEQMLIDIYGEKKPSIYELAKTFDRK